MGEHPRREVGDVRLVSEFASRIDTEGHEAGIEAREATLVAVGAVPGRRLDQDAAIDTIVEGLEAWPRHTMELPISVRSAPDDDRRRTRSREARQPLGTRADHADGSR